MLRRHLVLLATASLFFTSMTGCGGVAADPSKKLIGKWELSTEHLKEAMTEAMAERSKGKDGNSAGAAMGAAMMEGMLAQMKMSFDFQPGGKVALDASMMGQSKSEEGTWKVVSSGEDSLSLIMGMGDKESEPATVKFIDDDTIELIPPKGQAGSPPPGMAKIVLKRVK